MQGSPHPSGIPTPDALAALGKLRERLAAVRNLEHLISSRSVGPKVLVQVAPDVAGMLGLWDEIVATLGERVAAGLGLEAGRFTSLLSLGRAEVHALLRALHEQTSSLSQARSRLVMERVLNESMPALHAAVAHWELLVEATRTHSVSMSVGELLSSSPDKGSERPYRPLKVSGGLDGLHVSLPPRAALSCLAALGSIDPHLGLRVTSGGDSQVRFSFESVRDVQLVAQLPVFPTSSHVRLIVAAALAPHQGVVDQAGVSFVVPVSSL